MKLQRFKNLIAVCLAILTVFVPILTVHGQGIPPQLIEQLARAGNTDSATLQQLFTEVAQAGGDPAIIGKAFADAGFCPCAVRQLLNSLDPQTQSVILGTLGIPAETLPQFFQEFEAAKWANDLEKLGMSEEEFFAALTDTASLEEFTAYLESFGVSPVDFSKVLLDASKGSIGTEYGFERNDVLGFMSQVFEPEELLNVFGVSEEELNGVLSQWGDDELDSVLAEHDILEDDFLDLFDTLSLSESEFLVDLLEEYGIAPEEFLVILEEANSDFYNYLDEVYSDETVGDEDAADDGSTGEESGDNGDGSDEGDDSGDEEGSDEGEGTG